MSCSTHSHHWHYRPGQSLTLGRGHTTLASFVFTQDEAKPYIHPLRSPSGIDLTGFRPSDHPWHRAHWFTWKYLNGVNYWEEDKQLKSEGVTRRDGPETVAFDGDAAVVRFNLVYHPKDGEVILRESRAVRIDPAGDESYTIDWILGFTAVTDVTFDRTPCDDKTPWGGYAGLNCRMARTLVNYKAIDSEGRIGDKTMHTQRARWADLSGKSDGHFDLFAGVTMLDHPTNPRHPSPWYVWSQGMGFLEPALLMHEPMSLKAGEAMTLRYRVVLHDGLGEAARCESWWRAFVGA
ncbi:MAG: hypothetical protein GC164_04720 [Phycisphaera sp.]|nr:hypothetical protein [Phycisphaera sp.]